MSLRLRLIVAFFALSVVPLSGLTSYSYWSNARAVRAAAQREAELLAGELSQRMMVVTAQLSERVGHLMDMSQQAATPVATVATATPKTTPTIPAAVLTAGATPGAASQVATSAANIVMGDKVAEALGEFAMLLNNVELRGMGPGPGGPGGPGGSGGQGGRGGGRGGGGPDRGGRGGFQGPGPTGSGVAPAASGTPPLASGSPTPPSGGAPVGGANVGKTTASGTNVTPAAPPATPVVSAAPGASATPTPPPTDPSGAQTFGGDRRGGGRFRGDRVGPAPDPNRPPPTFLGPPQGQGQGQGRGVVPPIPPLPDPTADDKDRIRIDMAPIRRDMIRQMVPDGQWEKMTPEERSRVFAEVNQRMLGFVEGIKTGAAEIKKKVDEATREAAEQARVAALETAKAPGAPKSPAAPPPAPVPSATVAPAAPAPAPAQRKSAISGSRLDVTVEQSGQVRRLNAEINLENLLGTIFSNTRRDRGEVPFAVGKDGHIYTPTTMDRTLVEGLGAVSKPETQPGTTILPAYIVVTTADPTGAGLKFGIARPVGDSLSELRKSTARNVGFGLGFIGLALIGIVPLSGRLTKNLSTLSEGVRRIAAGDYHARVRLKTHDEIGELARAFNQMAEDVEKHQRSAVEQERIKRELELGRQIQHDMLPHTPLRHGLTEIRGVSVPAREVGGDFFNYFPLSSGQIALLVGDVSGKGVGAALLMANIQASLRTRLALGQNLAELAKAIDSDLDANTPGAVYATLFVGILDPEQRILRYVNAGHNPQFVLRRAGGLERMESSGLPVGMLSGRGYTEQSVQLAQSDLLFFYTDGCVEAENEAGEEFTTERLEALLIEATKEGTEDVLARVESVVSTFRGKREPFDDATMMAVKVG